MERQLLVYALPIFAICILLDFLRDRLTGKNRYSFRDTVASLSIGFFGTTFGILLIGLSALLYAPFYNNFAIFQVPNNWLGFCLAILTYDFFYYWMHRAHHRRNILWATHATHHNSEFFNFSTALRQSAFIALTVWPFFLPMAFLGFSPELYLTGAAVSVIYGFFTHAEGYDWPVWTHKILVSPSGHRVHHGTNPEYIDKNYGSIFSIWDVLFGTFQSFDHTRPITYGTLAPVESFDPFYANTAVLHSLYRQSRQLDPLNRAALWFRETGWPHTTGQKAPFQNSTWVQSLKDQERFHIVDFVRMYFVAIIYFCLNAIATAALMMNIFKTETEIKVLSVILLWMSLKSLAEILHPTWNGRQLYQWEFGRSALGLLLIGLALTAGPLEQAIFWAFFLFSTLGLNFFSSSQKEKDC